MTKFLKRKFKTQYKIVDDSEKCHDFRMKQNLLKHFETTFFHTSPNEKLIQKYKKYLLVYYFAIQTKSAQYPITPDPPFCLLGKQISQKLLLWRRNIIFALIGREALFQWKHFLEGDQQFFLNIFVFVIQWSSVKGYHHLLCRKVALHVQ